MSSQENLFRHLVTYELSTPEFLKRLQSGNAEEGEKACLYCEVIGDPVPTIEWFTEDNVKIAADNPHYQISYNLETGRAELKINFSLITDEQSYKCVASNVHGTAKTVGVLVVKGNSKYEQKNCYFKVDKKIFSILKSQKKVQIAVAQPESDTANSF